MMAKAWKGSISLDPTTVEAVRARAESESVVNFSGTVGEMLCRYLEALRRARVKLRPLFSPEECGLLIDVGNGTLYYPYSIALVWAEVADSISEGYAEKWGVDGPVLVEKLRALDYIHTCALVDAIERWWQGEYHRQPAAGYGKLLAEAQEPLSAEDA
jgi:hypothetical protein